MRPLLFHACNVAAHAGVTLLVYRLAQRLAAARRQEWGGAAGTRGGQDAAGSRDSWLAPAALEPLLAALLFALHPVHTEAVAGVVGHAELLCAALSIPALLCYMDAAEGRAGTGAGRWSGHWARVAAALALGWAAAGAKEIGVTIVSAARLAAAAAVPSRACRRCCGVARAEPEGAAVGCRRGRFHSPHSARPCPTLPPSRWEP